MIRYIFIFWILAFSSIQSADSEPESFKSAVSNHSDGRIKTVFAHGVVARGREQMELFKEVINTEEAVPVDFSDANNPSSWSLDNFISKICGKNINRAEMFMGQKKDITTMINAFKKDGENKQIIAYGCSRGAAAIFNAIAKHNPENVVGLILDAMPAHMPNQLELPLAKIGLDKQWCKSFFRLLFPAYPKNTMEPIEAIERIKNKNLPILLIHSEEDQTVPVENSYEMYIALKDAGFTRVCIHIIKQGNHSRILQHENDTIRNDYLTAVNTFYSLISDAPYEERFINIDLLNNFLEPSPEKINELTSKVKARHAMIQSVRKKAQIRNSAVALSCALGIALYLKYRKP